MMKLEVSAKNVFKNKIKSGFFTTPSFTTKNAQK
jgi:hypothetical protein